MKIVKIEKIEYIAYDTENNKEITLTHGKNYKVFKQDINVTGSGETKKRTAVVTDITDSTRGFNSQEKVELPTSGFDGFIGDMPTGDSIPGKGGYPDKGGYSDDVIADMERDERERADHDNRRKRGPFTFPDYTIDNETLTYYVMTSSSITISKNEFIGRTDFSTLIIKFSYDFSKTTPTKIIIGENAFQDCTNLDVVIFEINEQKNTGSNNNVEFNIAENAFLGCKLSTISLGVNFNTVANAMFSALNQDRRPIITRFFGATPRNSSFISITKIRDTISDPDNRPKGDMDGDKYDGLDDFDDVTRFDDVRRGDDVIRGDDVTRGDFDNLGGRGADEIDFGDKRKRDIDINFDDERRDNDINFDDERRYIDANKGDERLGGGGGDGFTIDNDGFTIDNDGTLTYIILGALSNILTIPENKFTRNFLINKLKIKYVHHIKSKDSPKIIIKKNAFKDCGTLEQVIFEIEEQKDRGSNKQVIFDIDQNAFSGCKLSTISLGVNFNTVANAMFSALNENRRPIITKFFGASPSNSSFITITDLDGKIR